MPQLNFQISTASAADVTLVAAVANQRVRVLGYTLVAAAPVTARLFDGPSPTTPLTGAMSLIAGTPLVVPLFDRRGASGGGEYWHLTSLGNGLILLLGAAVQVSGFMIVDQW